MNIAIDVRSLMEGRHSGVEEYTTQLIQALARVAPEHTYQLFYNSARPVTLPDFGQEVKVVPFRYPNKLLNAVQWAVAQPRWDRLVTADCFFVPSFRLLPLAPDVPLVTTVHDLSYERFPEFFSFKRRLWHALMRPRRLIERSAQVIAVSHATARDLTQLYRVPKDRLTVIHSGLGVPGDVSVTAQRQVRQKYALPEQFVLYFGALEPRKNVSGIVQSFSAIAERIPHDLLIAGEGGWKEGVTRRQLAISPVADRIHHIGFVEEADKWALYAAADVFVYPSFYEGFGFPPLEALACGTPVVTSFNASLPEVVGEWATLVDPYDTGELALVLEAQLAARVTVPQSVRAAVQQRYSWDAAARSTISVLERAVRG